MHEERNRKCAGVLITCNNNIIISVIVVKGNYYYCFRFGCHDKEEEYNLLKIPSYRVKILLHCV